MEPVCRKAIIEGGFAARFVMEQVQLVAAARLLSAACTITDAAITTYAADGCAHIHKGEF